MVNGLGVMLPSSDVAGTGIADLAGAAATLEDLGVGTVWAGDHLAFHTPVIDSCVALATAAAATTRVRLGFGVLLLALRPPAWAAKQITSLQVVSGGRVVLGIGVGGENPAEWSAAGVPARERGKRTDAVLRVLPGMLSGVPVHVPPPYDLDVPALLPAGPVPPIWIGGRSDHALRRAAAFGTGWLGMWADAGRVRRSRGILSQAAEELGRPRPRIGLHVFVHVGDETAAREDAAAFIWGQYRMNIDVVARYVALGQVGQVRDHLLELHEAGVDEFVLHPATQRQDAQYDRLGELIDALGPELG